MGESLHIVCPYCDGINRVPVEKLGAGGKCGRCHHALFAGRPVALTRENFGRHLAHSEIPLLVDFWAPWCGPCKMMAPVFERAAQTLEPRLRLAKVNTEEDQALAAQFGIRSIPTLMLFRNGGEVARLSGALDLTQLLAWVRQQIAV